MLDIVLGFVGGLIGGAVSTFIGLKTYLRDKPDLTFEKKMADREKTNLTLNGFLNNIGYRGTTIKKIEFIVYDTICRFDIAEDTWMGIRSINIPFVMAPISTTELLFIINLESRELQERVEKEKKAVPITLVVHHTLGKKIFKTKLNIQQFKKAV